MAIRHVYKVPGVGTVAAGKVQTGVLKPGMEVKFTPGNLVGEVKSI